MNIKLENFSSYKPKYNYKDISHELMYKRLQYNLMQRVCDSFHVSAISNRQHYC